MDKKKFNNLIQQPAKNIVNISEDEIDNLLVLFPYCEIVHVIALLKSKQKNSINFNNILNTTSTYSSNRFNLYNLINKKIEQKVAKKHHDFTTWLNSSSKKNKEIIKNSIEDNDFLTTETLAEIYVEQGHYKRAIQTYEILSLKYPKKSSFFANRINEIKNK